MDKIKKFKQYNSEGKLELIDHDDQIDYLEKYLNSDLILISNMNFLFLINKDKRFGQRYIELAEKYGIKINKKDKSFFYTTLLTTTLDPKELSNIFGEGIFTNELGEGIEGDDINTGMCFFYKLDGYESIYFYDNRGSSFEVDETMTKEKFLDYYFHLLDIILSKTNKAEELNELIK